MKMSCDNHVIYRQLMKPRPPDTKHFIEEALQLSRRRGLLSEVKVLDSVIKPPKPLAYYRYIYCC